MYYSKIEYCDCSNGVGARVTLFVSGCRIGCKGCFNKAAQNFKFGQEFTQEIINKILDSIDNEYVAGLSILGGEPFDTKNVCTVYELVRQFRQRFGNTKNIWCWTGYLLEDLQARDDLATQHLLAQIDVLVDGPFAETLKDPALVWRGSSNQRVLHKGVDF